MKPTINFDMDGTIANLYQVQDWLKMLRLEQTTPYKDAKPMVDYELATAVMSAMREQGFKFHIVSWGSKTGSENFLKKTSYTKRNWVKKYFPHVFTRYYITDYGVPKHETVKPIGNYLFDDNETVGKQWESAGGIWINVKQCDIIDTLKKIAAI